MPANSDIVNIIYIVIELLVPIIPAFIFHRWLPSESFVSGPLKGLKIDLTGAFASYFLLFFLLYLAPRPKTAEVWKVIGRIKPNSDITNAQLDFQVSPPLVLIPDGKSFEMILPIEIKDGKENFPNIVISCKPTDQFQTMVIHLNDEWSRLDQSIKFERNEQDHTITIDSPVEITKVDAPYSPPNTVLKAQ
jgi:hypothetical protein